MPLNQRYQITTDDRLVCLLGGYALHPIAPDKALISGLFAACAGDMPPRMPLPIELSGAFTVKWQSRLFLFTA
ncbi:hypothetical protein, partial [Ralstonia pseudosolanacearum]|uniref:hypothetical protein n=1 Tax=Ralstonia pseudosolanacearum TaxID=1310165 RepID=UPI003CF620E2